MNIGETIKFWRTQKGITQKQLASDAGVSEISIRKYEANDRVPKIGTIRKIAKALDVQTSDIDVHIMLDKFRAENAEIEQKRMELFERERQTGETFNEELHDLNMKNSDTLGAIIELEELIKEEAVLKYKNTKLLKAFNVLNEKGKDKAIEQIELLGKIPEYKN